MKALLIPVASLILISCGTNDTQKQITDHQVNNITVTLSDEQANNAGIQTGIAEERQLSSLLKVNGKIDVPPQNIISVSVPLGGYLTSTALLPGMMVKKGSVIATIEDQQYIQIQQDYLTSGTRLSYLEHEYQRQKDLNNNKATSDKVFQKTEADYKAEKILHASLSEKLKLIGMNPASLTENNISRSLVIRAPITGFVSAAKVNTGKYINTTDVLFELINPEDIHLVLTVFEKDLNKLAVGQKLYAYNNHQPEKKYRCEIILISRNLSDERSGEIHCHFEKYDPSLIPGMFMNADIEINSGKVLSLPETAVVSFESRQYVFIQRKKGMFDMTEVQTGKTENGFVELVSFPGSKELPVVTKGAYTLLMALKNKSDAE